SGKTPEPRGIGEELDERRERAAGVRSVEDAMVEGEGERAGRTRDDRTVDDQRARSDHPEREDRRLAGDEERRPRLRAVAPGVGDRDGAAGDLVGSERTLARGVGEARDLTGDLRD